ncbi:trigger factor [[Mycoplasma] anseris]|uniref:Trigger factor n=1 Tax=[Mycoplasma] anseris TaxID=92400 RepID=A0A2Z4NCV0_9BACT|nr:trigger factor [[Mycoplasma] anseris]AWX69316.1 trigger factor [[Mycoplasma] anseris]
MSKTVDKKNSLLKISYTIEGEEWANAIEKSKVELRKNVTVKGFRKGKAPAREADKHLNFVRVIEKAVDLSLDEIYKNKILPQVEKENIIGRPELNVTDLSPEKATIEVSFGLYPEIKLGDYKNLGVKLGKVALTKKEIAETQNQIVSSYVVMLDSQEPIAKNDDVNFDFQGFIDGKPFDGGDAQGYDLKIGSNQFIPGFEDAMIGLKAGEEKDLELAFPKDYHAKDLAGKPVVFHVKINFVKTPSYPTIDEQFIKEINLPLVSSVEEFEEFVKLEAKRQKTIELQNNFMEKANAKLLKDSKLTLPHSLIREEALKYYQNLLNNLKQQQITEAEYLEFTKNTKENILAEYDKLAEPKLKEVFILGEIAKVEKFEVTDEDYEKEITKLADLYGVEASTVKGFLRFENVQMNLTNKFIIDLLIKSNDKEGYAEFKKVMDEIEAFDNKKTEIIVAQTKQARAEKEKAKETKNKDK